MNKITCLVCKKKFKKITNTHLKNKHGMTSAEYKEQYSTDIIPNQKKKIVECEYCANGVEKNNPNAVQRNFCDEQCYGKWRSENIRGENHPQYEGYEDNYGGEWKRIREKVKKRDNNRCQFCDEHQSRLENTLNVHHIIPFSNFDSRTEAHNMMNLITLCRSCHMALEGVGHQKIYGILYKKMDNMRRYQFKGVEV